MNYRFIAIEGNIGAGKTTLCKKLAKDLNYSSLLEEFENNPFLENFYTDPKKFAFQLECSFLMDRRKQLKEYINEMGRAVLSDFSILKSYVFAQVNLNDEELELYNRIYNLISKDLAQPDLLIYLHSNVDQLRENIEIRGRTYEKAIDDDYLIKLQHGYSKRLREIDRYPVVLLDLNNLNFVQKEDDYQFIKNLLGIKWKTGINIPQENNSFSGF